VIVGCQLHSTGTRAVYPKSGY